ncbi:TPA: type 4b pilus protein PilO2 [Yersinia enterocolitica]|nr:type 4b pilus protein PilO2 [Yersinia enterocolitica]
MDENKLKATAITLSKVNFIVGVTWESVENGKSRALKKKAKRAGFDYWLSIKSVDVNDASFMFAGVDSSVIDYNEKYPLVSLAHHVQKFHSKNSYSIFEVNESKYWFVAFVNGNLSPLSDLYGSKDKIINAVNLFLSLTSKPSDGWDVISPNGFLDQDYRTENIRSLAQRSKPQKSSYFHKTHDKLGAALWAVVVALALLIYFGNEYYQERQLQDKIEVAQKELALKRKNMLENRLDELKPWGKKPLLHDYLKVCSETWKVAPLSIAGWRFKTAKCQYNNGVELSLSYLMMKGSTVDYFNSRLPYWFHKFIDWLELRKQKNGLFDTTAKFNIPGAANEAMFKVPIGKIEIPKPEELLNFDYQTQRLTSYAQRMNAELRLQESNTDHRDDDGAITVMPWRAIDFTFVTDIPLDRLFDASRFDDSGIRANSITLELVDYRIKYTIEGTVYASK